MKLKYFVFASLLTIATVSCADQNELVAPAPVQPLEAVNTGGGTGSTEDTGMSINPTDQPVIISSAPVSLNEGR